MEKRFWLTIDDLAGKKVNMHTHTTRCHHAVGEDRAYVEKAIEAGYEILGFSDHAPYIFDGDFVSGIRMSMNELEGYVKSIESLKKEYEKDITIYTGFEMEFFPKHFHETKEKLAQYPIDYLLLGQHYFDDEIGFVSPNQIWTEEVWIEKYVNRVIEALNQDCFLYVAHPDIIHYVGSDAIYEKHMRRLAKEFKQRMLPIEINVIGVRQSRQYPDERFINIGIENGNEFMIGVDAHNPEHLLDIENINKARQLVTSKGGKLVGK